MYEDKIRGKISVIEFADLERAAAEGNPELFRNNDWMTLGPFVMETGGAFETEYMYKRHLILEPDYLTNDGGEAGIVPYLGRKVRSDYLGGEEHIWQQGVNKWGCLRFEPNDCDSACHEALFLTEQRNGIFYAAVYVRCDGPKRAVLCYEDSGSRLFLNGQLIADYPYGRVKGVSTMGHLVPVNFHDGLNLLLFKIRPGYICDTLDLCVSNCMLWPVAAQSGNLGLSYPVKTKVFTERDEKGRQIFPCAVAAFGDSDGGLVEVDGFQKVEVKEMKAGQCQLVRAEIAVGDEIQLTKAPVSITANGCEKSDAEFAVMTDPMPAFKGKGNMKADFHFDTTYHQEQRSYAIGAIYITREILKEMRKDPKFNAVISEVDYLHPYYSLYPEDREFLKNAFIEGRAEADCFYNQPNEMTSAPEGVVRNMLYGQLYHRDVMGRICGIYSPGDVFGHFNQMSQVSAKGGCTGVFWGKHIFGFPPAFRHVSPDGTDLLHIRGGLYQNAAVEWDLSICDEGGWAMANIPGYPVDGDLSWADETVHKSVYQAPSKNWDTLYDDEKRIEGEGKHTPFASISRDMSLYHAGVSLTRSEFKQANRLGENLLISAEKFSTIASLLGAQYPEKALDKAWRQLLCGQHHDSITGTNNEVSFVDLMIEYREAVELAADILDKAVQYVASNVAKEDNCVPVVVFNPHTWDRSEVVSVEVTLAERPERYLLKNPEGNAVSFRVVSCEETDDGYKASVSFKSDVPAFGYASYALSLDEGGAVLGDAVIEGSDTVIENEFYRIEIDPARGGGIVSLFDKQQGRELVDLTVDGPANRILALKETHDRMETQHEFYTTGHRLSSEHYEAEVKSEKCADYQKLTLTYYLGNISPITQVITLNNGSGRIDFETRCDDYRDEDDLFCVTFPTTLKGVRPVFDDRYAPQVRNESRRSMDFRTHQYAMFSHCAVYAANQWMDYGPSVTVNLDEQNAVNMGMTQIIRTKGSMSENTVDKLLLALTKKAVPCTVFSDKMQPNYGSQIIHYNEDLTSETRFVLSVAGDGNLYVEKLLNEMDPDLKAKALAAMEADGYSVVFLRDADNLWKKPIDVFLVLAANAEAIDTFTAKVEADCAAGRFIDMPCLLAVETGKPDDYGVALLNTGNIACSVEKGGMLNLMLFHTAEFYGNIGKTNCGAKLVPEHKSHVFTYSLYPHTESYREAELYRRALELNDPLLAVAAAETRADAALPAAKSFIRTEGNAIVTAVKAGGAPMASMSGKIGSLEERGITIRCFEPDGVSAHTRLYTGFDVKSGVRTDLLEEGNEPANLQDNVLDLVLTSHEIETVRLTPAVAAADTGAVLGAQTEIVEPTYIRSWEHDLGTMPMGYLSVAAVISRNSSEPDDLHICTEVSIANNYGDQAISGVLDLELPEGWSADWTQKEYNVEPTGCAVFPVTFTKPTEDAKGIIRLTYVHDGQTFCDVFEVGYFDPEFAVTYTDGELKATVLNPTSQRLIGELWMATPVETWGGMDGKNPFGKTKISPYVVKVDLAPGEQKIYDFEVSGDENISWYAVGKLCVNGRIHFSGVEKKGPRHCVWAHLLVNDLYEDGGSLAKLLKM